MVNSAKLLNKPKEQKADEKISNIEKHEGRQIYSETKLKEIRGRKQVS